MKKILIATDGSSASTDAVEFGLELVAEQDAEAIFVHVAPEFDAVPVGGLVATGAVRHELTDCDRAPLDAAADAAAAHGVEATTTLLVADDPADEVHGAAKAAA